MLSFFLFFFFFWAKKYLYALLDVICASYFGPLKVLTRESYTHFLNAYVAFIVINKVYFCIIALMDNNYSRLRICSALNWTNEGNDA